jgi:hypothetical protein
MSRVRSVLNERGGSLVITSAVTMPQRLSFALNLPSTGTVQIPPFTRDEIAGFLIARGCPGPQVADLWAAFVELHTSGHAQLVHARIAALEAQDFPLPETKILTEVPHDLVEARAEARR